MREAKPKHFRDGESGPCFICGKPGKYVLMKGKRSYLTVKGNGDVAGFCLKNVCFNLGLLSDALEWTWGAR